MWNNIWVRKKVESNITNPMDSMAELIVFDDSNSPELLSERDQFIREIGSLFDTKSYSDVTFIVKDSKFRGHKSVLSVRCAYFNALFSNWGKKKRKRNWNTWYGTCNLQSCAGIPLQKQFITSDGRIESKCRWLDMVCSNTEIHKRNCN